MYNDMYETEFCNTCIYCGNTFSREQQKAYWSYGDTVLLNFDIAGIDLTDETASIRIIFYDYEFKPIYCEEFYVTEFEEPTIHYILDACQSSKTFKRGVYYCGLKHRYITGGYEVIKTIVNPQSFQLTVV